MLRMLRVVRTFSMFSNLRVLVSAVAASFLALFWSMVLLSGVMLMAALFLCQASGALLESPSMDDATKEWVYLMYGTSSRAYWSVFELTFSGGWPNYARPLVEHGHWFFCFFFAFYISAVVFAMFRIITALFLKETLSMASLDVETIITERIREKKVYAQKLAEFFIVADTSGDGYLSWDEFQHVLKDERVAAYLSTMQIDMQDGKRLFEMLDDGVRGMSVDDFVSGAMRIKTQARAQDVVLVRQDCQRLMQRLDRLSDLVEATRVKA
mmetsp:Transcript_47782/g.134552  ORF Transcript_47782/g.134552 Transcript_47782/m.134552 type:complete len:268 (-) Transcript_47782:43-846(-)